MARGTVNTPAKKPKIDLEALGAQSKLTGKAGQYVGFDEKGKTVAKDPLKGTQGQVIGFDEKGNQVAQDLPQSGGGASAFFGTIGTDWTEDVATGVKSQLVAIEGVLAAHQSACLDVIMTHERTTEGYTLFVEEKNQFLQYITNGDAETVDGGVMFYIYGEPNTVEIPFALEVV